MKRRLFAGALAALALSTTAAHASVTLDFNEFIHGDDNYRSYAGGIETHGFKIDSDVASKPLINWNLVSQFNPDRYGATMMTGGSQAHAVFTKVGGGAFNLNSVDLTDGANTPVAGFFDLTWFDGTETFTETLQLDRVKGLQTFNFNKENILWFSLGTSGWAGGNLQFDNVVLDAPVVSGVPEPTTWALMITGFGLAGTALRRRRRQALTLA